MANPGGIENKTPAKVIALAILFFIEGGISILAFLFLSGIQNFDAPFTPNDWVFAFLATLVPAVLSIVTGVGLIKLKKWSWVIGICLISLEIVSLAFSILQFSVFSIADLVIIVAFVLLILSYKNFFPKSVGINLPQQDREAIS